MIKVENGSPFMEEALGATFCDVQYATASIVQCARMYGEIDRKRIDEIDDFITNVESKIYDEVDDYTKSDIEYYACIGSFIVDMWLTFYGNMKTDVDMYKMQEEFGSFDE